LCGKEQPVISDRRVSIVVLNGSPHRDGNTATLMGWVVAGCVEAGASVEWIHLVDHSIDYCQGCFTCLRTGECHIQDGFAQVRRRMEMADGIIVGSPMYAGQPTAQLKTFLDRLTLLNLYTHVFERQRSVAVVTSGVAPTRSMARELAVHFGCCSDIVGARTASVGRGYQPLVDVHHPRLPERARVVGLRLVGDIHRAARWRFPTREQVYFHLLRRLVIRPLVMRKPEQFAGVLAIWREKGWL